MNIKESLDKRAASQNKMKSLLNQKYLLEEAFAKGGNSDNKNFIPSRY